MVVCIALSVEISSHFITGEIQFCGDAADYPSLREDD